MKDGLWHECPTPFWPRRDINGRWTCFEHGQCLRRWNGLRWEYKMLEETFDQWADRQW